MNTSQLVLYDDFSALAGSKGVGLPARMQSFYRCDLFMSPLVEGRATANVNFVVRRDGVVNIPEDPGGKAINGGNIDDMALMAILRATHDAVMVGSETLASEPKHLWTPSFIHADFGAELEDWRLSRGQSRFPVNIIVSRSCLVKNPNHSDKKTVMSLDYPVFNTPGLKAIIATTPTGAAVLTAEAARHPNVSLLIVESTDDDFERELLVQLWKQYKIQYLLIEGGPTVNGAFHKKDLVTDDFLTLAPGMAGRAKDSRRATLMMGYEFPANKLPEPTLISVRRSGNHLLIRERYAPK